MDEIRSTKHGGSSGARRDGRRRGRRAGRQTLSLGFGCYYGVAVSSGPHLLLWSSEKAETASG